MMVDVQVTCVVCGDQFILRVDRETPVRVRHDDSSSHTLQYFTWSEIGEVGG